MVQPPYQPANPQEAPIPRGGRIEKFNEEDRGDEGACSNCGCFCTDVSIEACPCKDGGCSDCGCGMEKEGNYDRTDLDEEEPDPSNPDRELDIDPDIPDPVDKDKDIEEKEKEKEPFDGEPITTDGLEVPDKIEIPERLFNDLQMMIEYSITNDKEAGGFLIIAEHGNLGVVGEQFGKEREIVLEPNEQLHKGEMLIGTCVRPETLILGDNKSIETMVKGDMAFGLSGHNKVIDKAQREFNGNMVKIKGSGLLPFETTPEHLILVVHGSSRHKNHKLQFEEPIWKEAKDLLPKNKKEGDYLIIPRLVGRDSTTVCDLTSFIKGNKWSIKQSSIPLNEDFAWLLGLYTAEGYSRGDTRGFGFALNRDEKVITTKIERILGKVTIKQRPENGIVVECYYPILGRALKKWCGANAHEKKIPDFILYHKNDDILKAFLKGYEEGDGNKGSHNEFYITTVSKLLVQQYQVAWARFGIVTNIAIRDRRNRISFIDGRMIKGGLSYQAERYDQWHKGSHSKVMRDFIFSPIRKIESQPYNGQVYNIETTDNTYLVSNIIVHNCHMHPVTPTASTGDVSGYLNDENEKVMVVVGADKSINIFFKTDFTAEGDYGDEISDNFEQGDMDMLCEELGFIWYRAEESDRTVASIITHIIDNVELEIVDETWPIEDLVKGLGIKGRPEIPEEYSTKKTPLRLQIPFAFRCNEIRLRG